MLAMNVLKSLVSKGYAELIGIGRGTKYGDNERIYVASIALSDYREQDWMNNISLYVIGNS